MAAGPTQGRELNKIKGAERPIIKQKHRLPTHEGRF